MLSDYGVENAATRITKKEENIFAIKTPFVAQFGGEDVSQPEIEAVFQKHKQWKEDTKLRATPTILVNGYKLPENYRIEDLRYFAEFDFEVE
jgi:protein-disulfide isomerase